MPLKSKVIHKNNKYRELEPNPLIYNKKTSKMRCPKLPAKLCYFRKMQNFQKEEELKTFLWRVNLD